MDARPLLERLARALAVARLEAVLVGNAAAALQGAPLTTLGFDFTFRKTPANIRKLKAVARHLGASILRPYYPASELFRVVNDDVGAPGRLHGEAGRHPLVRNAPGARHASRVRGRKHAGGGSP